LLRRINKECDPFPSNLEASMDAICV
jgi:hypothetical protein